MKQFFGFVLMMICLMACKEKNILSGKWELQCIVNEAEHFETCKPEKESKQIIIEFSGNAESGKAKGNTWTNKYSFDYSCKENGGLEISPVLSTKVGERGLSRLFLMNIKKITSYQLKGESLILKVDDKKYLKFSKLP